eukprot:gene17211-6897_t
MGDRYAGFALALNERLVAVENLLHRCSRHTHLTDAARCRPRTTAGVVEKVINEVTRAADIEASKEIFSDIYSKGSTALEKRLTTQIAESIMETLGPTGVAVVVKAKHMCMMMRGVQKATAETVTSAMLGVFRHDPKTRDEFMRFTSGN